MLNKHQLRKIVYGALAVGLLLNAMFHVFTTEVFLAAGCTSLFFIEE